MKGNARSGNACVHAQATHARKQARMHAQAHHVEELVGVLRDFGRDLRVELRVVVVQQNRGPVQQARCTRTVTHAHARAFGRAVRDGCGCQ